MIEVEISKEKIVKAAKRLVKVRSIVKKWL